MAEPLFNLTLTKTILLTFLKLRRKCYGTISFRTAFDCSIFLYPVSGSIFIHECNNCTIYLAGQQLRIHDSINLRIHTMVSSGPIIEGCSEITFAGDYVQRMWNVVEKETNESEESFKGFLRKSMMECTLLNDATRESEDAHNQFHNVKDFNWHKVQKSPNFYVVASGEVKMETQLDDSEDDEL